MDAAEPSIYVIRFEEVFWGGTLVAVTMALHCIGMLTTLRVIEGAKSWLGTSRSFAADIGMLVLASWMILVVHLVEVLAWAYFFVWQNAVNSQSSTPANASLCYYFALMDYTTLGSDYNLHVRWRLLEGMIAVAGLLTFAWSTGLMLTLAQEFQDRQMERIKERRAKAAAKLHAHAAHASPHAPPHAQMPGGSSPHA